MSVLALGSRAKCGVLTCETLVAKNDPGGDPHKITGDLEVTGDLKVDGGITVELAGFKGLILNSNPQVNQVNIAMNDNTQTWDISADAGSSQLGISHTVAGAGSGAEVAGFTVTGASTFGCYLPGAPFIIQNIPTTLPALSGQVWSDGGTLKIVP